MEIKQESEKVKIPKGIIVKYAGPLFGGRIRFGKFKDYPSWVKYMNEQEKEGNPIELCMWYYNYKDEKEDPNFKEVYNDPNFGSAFVKWDNELEE